MGKLLEAVAGDGKPKKGGRSTGKPRSKSLLPSPPPAAGATRDELIVWLTAALALEPDPVDRVERYGLSQDARLVIVLRSGGRVTFDRAGDVFDPRSLHRIVVLATSAPVPHYGQADTEEVARGIVRVADTLADEDARAEARDWGRTFLEEAAANVVDVADLTTAPGRYEAISILTSRRVPDPYTSPASRAVLVRDAEAGAHWVRSGDLGAHVRAEAGRAMPWPAIYSRMVEAGWRNLGEVQQRQPGGRGKVRARVLEAPAGWDQ